MKLFFWNKFKSRRTHDKKAIIWSTFVATLLLIAGVIYFLVEQFKLNIIIVSLLVTGAFSSIAGTAKWFFREKFINSLI
jgi:membrane-anchored protein YejM (alkaline phosphatase superfamily)